MPTLNTPFTSGCSSSHSVTSGTPGVRDYVVHNVYAVMEPVAAAQHKHAFGVTRE